jgi:hypothetical protein
VEKRPRAIQFAQESAKLLHQREPLIGSQNPDHVVYELFELARLILVYRTIHAYSLR